LYVCGFHCTHDSTTIYCRWRRHSIRGWNPTKCLSCARTNLWTKD
jgi:hypothetical protein